MLFRKLRRLARSYFALNTRERRGIVFLTVLLVLEIVGIIGFRLYQHYMPPAFEPVELQQLSVLQLRLDSIEQISTRRHAAHPSYANLFAFDPNHTSLAQWQQLGLSEKQAAVIIRYLEKGGRFKTKADLAKMYVVREEDYNRLEPFIQIPPSENHTAFERRVSISMRVEVELNSADSIMLCRLKGIGPGRSRMIIRYRDALGGFYDIAQLKEVYTIDSLLFDSIKPHVRLNTELVKTFNINADSIRHPYLNQKLAKVVIAYRKQHGPYGSVDDLKQVKWLDNNTLRKLAPYLRFE